MKPLYYTAALAVLLSAFAAAAADKPTLKVKADGFDKDGIIKPEYAFCAIADQGHVQAGQDQSIGLSWSAGPEGTKSYAIIGYDPDVPSVFDDANQEGKVIPADMQRKRFYHWVLFDIPAATHKIDAGQDSHSLVNNGKTELRMPYGMRGVNDYAGYMASNPARKGVYAGYDGPCPPWNDDRTHHYYFDVFALDVPTLGLSGAVTGPQVEEALRSHILAQGFVVGKYSLNPVVIKMFLKK